MSILKPSLYFKKTFLMTYKLFPDYCILRCQNCTGTHLDRYLHYISTLQGPEARQLRGHGQGGEGLLHPDLQQAGNMEILSPQCLRCVLLQSSDNNNNNSSSSSSSSSKAPSLPRPVLSGLVWHQTSGLFSRWREVS